MDLYIKAYNHMPDPRYPKIKYTDLVNEALDTFLSAHKPVTRARGAPARKK